MSTVAGLMSPTRAAFKASLVASLSPSLEVKSPQGFDVGMVVSKLSPLSRSTISQSLLPSQLLSYSAALVLLSSLCRLDLCIGSILVYLLHAYLQNTNSSQYLVHAEQ